MDKAFNDKISVHLQYMLDLTKGEFIEYAFTKFDEYENDEELSSFFLMQIGKMVFNIKGNNLKNIINLKEYDKKYLLEALYKYYYDEINAFRGPLNNILSELLDDNIDKPFIDPYMHLVIVLLYNKSSNVSRVI